MVDLASIPVSHWWYCFLNIFMGLISTETAFTVKLYANLVYALAISRSILLLNAGSIIYKIIVFSLVLSS